MRRLIFAAFFSVLFLFGHAVCAQEKKPLRLGIMPFNSALALIKTHQPLRQYLEGTLGRKVEIYTSSDYYTFFNELLAGQFDIAIAGPHFGSMAVERGWAPLVRYSADLQPVFVVARQSTIQTLDDLRGKRIGLSSMLSISSIGGVKWLGDQGLHLGRDFFLAERATHGAAIASVAVGDLDAALTTYTPLKQIPEDVLAKVKVLPLDTHVPHLMTLARTALGKPLLEQLHSALSRFPQTEEGKAFFKSTGYEGYQDVTAKDLANLKPFVKLTLQMMRVDH